MLDFMHVSDNMCLPVVQDGCVECQRLALQQALNLPRAHHPSIIQYRYQGHQCCLQPRHYEASDMAAWQWIEAKACLLLCLCMLGGMPQVRLHALWCLKPHA